MQSACSSDMMLLLTILFTYLYTNSRRMYYFATLIATKTKVTCSKNNLMHRRNKKQAELLFVILF